MKDSDRIKLFLGYIKKSKNAAGISIGDKNGMRFQYVETGRNGISEKFARDITNIYPEISYTWLLTGEGEMLRKNDTNAYLTESQKKYLEELKKRPDYNDHIIITNKDRNVSKESAEQYIERLRNRPDYEDHILMTKKANSKEVTITTIKKENTHLEDKIRMQSTIIDLLKENESLKKEIELLKSKVSKIEK